jgi:hypothetical protein
VLLTLQRYVLDDHISSDAPTLDDPHWRRMDSVVLSWLLGTNTVDLQETTHPRDHGCGCDRTAQQLWVALEEQFLDNREARALHLGTQFWLFIQGDLSVDDYCRRMKWMVDDLCDLGEHMEDRTLVLQVIWGLNKKYDHVKIYLKRAWSFPSFHDVRNDLLEELTLDTEASSGSVTALAASGGQRQRLHPPLPNSVDSRPPLLPLTVLDQRLPPALAAVAAAGVAVVVAAVVVATVAVARVAPAAVVASVAPPHRLLARAGAVPPGRPSTTPGLAPSICG